MSTGYVIAVIVAMGVVTFALRALPFVAARWLRSHPLAERLGRFLPLAIMTLLLIHSALGAARQHASFAWPELLAVAIVVLLQWSRRNALLSILGGTALYVLLLAGAAAQPYGPVRANEANTRGWQLMTPEERIEHQATIRGFKAYEQCREYQIRHHERMQQRARERGLTLPARRRDFCEHLASPSSPRPAAD